MVRRGVVACAHECAFAAPLRPRRAGQLFSAHQLARARSYNRGSRRSRREHRCAARGARRPRSAAAAERPLDGARADRERNRRRRMVLLVALSFVGLPFSLFDLWWQHHWGLGPFDVFAWLAAQWSTLGPEVIRDGHDRPARRAGGPVPALVATRRRSSSSSLRCSRSSPGGSPQASRTRSTIRRSRQTSRGSSGSSTCRGLPSGWRTCRRGPIRRTCSRSGSGRRRTSCCGHDPRRALLAIRAGRRDRTRVGARAQPAHHQGDRLERAAGAADAPGCSRS